MTKTKNNVRITFIIIIILLFVSALSNYIDIYQRYENIIKGYRELNKPYNNSQLTALMISMISLIIINIALISKTVKYFKLPKEVRLENDWLANKYAGVPEKERLAEEKRQNEYKECLDNYNSSKSKYNIPKNAQKITYKSKSAKSTFQITKGSFLVWIEENSLSFFPAQPTINNYDRQRNRFKPIALSMNQIEFFNFRGEVYRENKISGGGGGGSSLGGAIVGGVIAGGAGAVIGSRKKNEPIKSELVTHDNRETFINYFNASNERCSLFFDYKDINVFRELMLHKEYNQVNTQSTISFNNSQSKGIADEIREFAKLKDEGLITEEEYNLKKQELLLK